jgi:ABC-type multidrug transport system fused ATPase/permease subunit
VMQNVILQEFDGRTIISITHDPDTLMDFDRVVVMSDSRIKEVGSPGELVQDRASLFRQLIDIHRS